MGKIKLACFLMLLAPVDLHALATGTAPTQAAPHANPSLLKTSLRVAATPFPFCDTDEDCDWPERCACRVIGLNYCCQTGVMIPIPIDSGVIPVPIDVSGVSGLIGV